MYVFCVLDVSNGEQSKLAQLHISRALCTMDACTWKNRAMLETRQWWKHQVMTFFLAQLTLSDSTMPIVRCG